MPEVPPQSVEAASGTPEFRTEMPAAPQLPGGNKTIARMASAKAAGKTSISLHAHTRTPQGGREKGRGLSISNAKSTKGVIETDREEWKRPAHRKHCVCHRRAGCLRRPSTWVCIEFAGGAYRYPRELIPDPLPIIIRLVLFDKLNTNVRTERGNAEG